MKNRKKCSNQNTKTRDNQRFDTIIKGTRRKLLKSSSFDAPHSFHRCHSDKTLDIKQNTDVDNDNRSKQVRCETDPIVSSLMNRISSLFQRRGNNRSNNVKSDTLPEIKSHRPVNFDNVRNELMTLKRFHEGCEEDQKI